MKKNLFFFLCLVLLLASCSVDEDLMINEGELVFSDLKFNLDENVPTATFVGIINAINVVAGRTLTYQIMGNNTPFVLNEETGELFVGTDATIDFEVTPSYTFTVEAFNGNTTEQAQITVTINDVTEYPSSSDEKPD